MCCSRGFVDGLMVGLNLGLSTVMDLKLGLSMVMGLRVGSLMVGFSTRGEIDGFGW